MNTVAAYQAAQGHDPNALVVEHQSLVRRIAWHLMARLPSSVEVDDLIQAGQIGLIEAARNYRSDGGAAFATYASTRIRGAMLDELRRGDWIPRRVHRGARAISDAVSAVEARTGRAATDQEIAAEMQLSLSDYYDLAQDTARGPLLSLDALNDDGGDAEMVDVATGGADTGVCDDAFRRALIDAIRQLPQREAQVMSLYYDESLNLREIGSVLGVSESRICQIHAQAVARLRARLSDWT